MGSGENRFSSIYELEKTIEIPTTRANRPFKDPTFLHQKYVIEGLSPKEIAAQIFSSRQSVKKYLQEFGIQLRQEDMPRRGPLPFGKRWKKSRPTTLKREQEAIEKMVRLRTQGLSFQKIADVLNAMSIPPQNRKARWHGQSVYRVLARTNANI